MGQTKHRFDVYSTVFLMNNNKIIEAEVVDVKIYKSKDQTKVSYNLSKSQLGERRFDFFEKELFKTKQELLDSL